MDVNFFFMLPPSLEELKKRLELRGTEDSEAINKRLEIAREELQRLQDLNFFDRKLVNDNFDEFYSDFLEWMQIKYPTLDFSKSK